MTHQSSETPRSGTGYAGERSAPAEQKPAPQEAEEVKAAIERLKADMNLPFGGVSGSVANSLTLVRIDDLALAISSYEERGRMLAACYRAAGSDTDGDEEWRYAGHALDAVQQLRKDYEEASDEIAEVSRSLSQAQDRIVELEAGLKTCGEVLRMLTEPSAIRSTSVHNAWAQAVAAEAKVRKLLATTKAETPSEED